MKKLLLILFLVPNFLFAKEQCENMQQPPEEFMGMKLKTFQIYDDSRLGVGVTYRIKSVASLSAYKFDYGFQDIDETTLKKFTGTAIDEIKIMADRQGRKFKGEYDISEEEISPILKYSYAFVSDKGLVDFLSIGSDGSCIYKVRYSERSQSDSIQKFVDLARAIEGKMKD